MVQMTLSVIFTVVAATAAVATGGARYPAGVDPSLCPDYPHCNNALLATAVHGSHYDVGSPAVHYDDGNHVGHYDNGQYDDGSYKGHYDDGSYKGHYDDGRYDDGSYKGHYDDGRYDDGRYGGVGLSHGSVGYRQQGHLQYGAAPVHLGSLLTEPGYPAGLTSSDCPNYPYCSHKVRSFQAPVVQNGWYPYRGHQNY